MTISKEQVDGSGESLKAQLRDTEDFLDTQILRILGVRFEIQDDIAKLWPVEVEVPDETNWVMCSRLSRSAGDCARLIRSFGYEVTFHSSSEADTHWVVAHADDAEIESEQFPNPDVAAAAVLYTILHAMSKEQKNVHKPMNT